MAGQEVAPRMDTHALLALLLAVLGRDAFGRSPEGALGRENIREEAKGVGELTSPVSVLTPWELRSLSPERKKRSLGRQDRNYGGQYSVDNIAL
ncbi:uncharacterized protein LOC119569839 [Penaeus monodon]|uniref:uncharacterized protein LOC119569839 n=1 Tax=Penaeus monodon TaxID=6687 RepID=UPI0018A7B0D7|nr:uncharacterized protein LOC119569839 [Penaeus monodon]